MGYRIFRHIGDGDRVYIPGDGKGNAGKGVTKLEDEAHSYGNRANAIRALAALNAQLPALEIPWALERDH
jgi:hypothetical protein